MPVVRSIDVDCIEKPVLVVQCNPGTHESINFEGDVDPDIDCVLALRSWESEWSRNFTG
jgi:hypothetical protein